MTEKDFECYAQLSPFASEAVWTPSESEAREIEFAYRAEIRDGDVWVHIRHPDLNKLADKQEYRSALLQDGQRIADELLSEINFFKGTSYVVDIRSGRTLNHKWKANGMPMLGDDTLNIEDPPETALESLRRLRHSSIHYDRALRDYSSALRCGPDAGFHCYRAIECVCRHYCNRDRLSADNWRAMHAKLGTDESTVKKIVKDTADKMRHGTHVPSDYHLERIWMALQYTRDVLWTCLIDNSPSMHDVRRPCLGRDRVPGWFATASDDA